MNKKMLTKIKLSYLIPSYFMKTILFALFFVSISRVGVGQKADTLDSGKSVREKVLSDIQASLEGKTKAINSTASKLDRKVDSIDFSIKSTSNASGKEVCVHNRGQAKSIRCSRFAKNSFAEGLEGEYLFFVDGFAISKAAVWSDYFPYGSEYG
ncbi:MAG TPA: hypothetical protein VNV85_13390 [Puia sp.]|jgi:hypothetical protein|nr:hypothetical protein [Puia sp.]